MSKKMRQQMILDIITKKNIYTLADLLKELALKNYRVNISTLSRDFTELSIVKTVEGYRVLQNKGGGPEILPSQATVLQQMVTGINLVGNIVLVHTITGGAQAVARLLDLMPEPFLAGTVAGDDTIIGIADNAKSAKKFFDWISIKIEGS